MVKFINDYALNIDGYETDKQLGACLPIKLSLLLLKIAMENNKFILLRPLNQLDKGAK